MPPIIKILFAAGGFLALAWALIRGGKDMSTGKRILTIIGMFLIVGYLIQYLYDPLAPLANEAKLRKTQSQLNAAKTKWNSWNISDYSFAVEYYTFSALGGCGATITVRNGSIVGVVETQQGGWEKLAEPRALDEAMWDKSGYCNYSRFTIPEVFDDLQKRIRSGGMLYASFHPGYGFVTEYSGSANVRHGLLRGNIADSEYHYILRHFQKFDTSAP